jgi:hypothetical protein
MDAPRRSDSNLRFERRKSLLFLKKKKQKDFYFSALPPSEAMARIVPQHQEQKSFASFLQKRRPAFLLFLD